jgi:hypothetical protein
MINVGDVFMEYNKEKKFIVVWSQGYDSSFFNADDFFECVNKIKME